MKIMTSKNPCFKRLVICATGDKSKPQLRALFYSQRYNRLVATDGIRLYGTKLLKMPETDKNEVFNLTSFAEKGELRKDPEIEGVGIDHILSNQDHMKYRVQFQVPDFLGKLHAKRGQPSCPITLKLDTKNKHADLFLGYREEGHLYFNGALLRPVAGQDVILHFSGKPVESAAITPLGDRRNVVENDWFLIFMPCRPTDKTEHAFVKVI